MSAPQVALVVATRNRPTALASLLEGLSHQTVQPSSVVVVDASDDHVATEVRAVVNRFSPRPVLTHSTRRSLPAQRNIGITHVLEKHRADYVLFLDDDVRPAVDYIERLAMVLDADTVHVIGGVSGVSQWKVSEVPRRFQLYQSVFRLNSKMSGALLRSGINIPVPSTSHEPTEADWLFGCSMWRREVVEEYRFFEALPGSALFEDVDFSARVARRYRLVVEPRATLDHLLADEGRPDVRTHYRRYMRNRHAMVRRVFGTPSATAAFWWSSAGELALLARHGIPGSSDYRERLVGALEGCRDAALGGPFR